ncbi:hypothetical protein HYH03_002195 [Edaphochlamys debaryana]|uniref:Protein kinase domain-containing protein n=1 Tax=Edaphochlamys debaryana TaxID=47281 RepID=A0A835YBK2_9CHLO|nr:hypothetical protein HYH03_002195 [Edaphochlamys debaryana]|eukprot:KAG2499907.1 hypothetical protein HYH03_002195 [Edaphochlamys debaryana]
MDLLHTAVLADGSARAALAHVAPSQLVHVAHLGLGACCSVDLVAVHCPDGSRLVAAAKSCFLPRSDTRMRASAREEELLRRCADCPFIMQLLAVVEEVPDEGTGALGNGGLGEGGCYPLPGGMAPTGGGAAWGGSAGSPVASGRSSLQSPGAHRHGSITSQGNGNGSFDAAAFPVRSQASATALASPGYQQWAQWRGGGTADDLQRQVLQRLSAASMTQQPGSPRFHSLGQTPDFGSLGGGWAGDGPASPRSPGAGGGGGGNGWSTGLGVDSSMGSFTSMGGGGGGGMAAYGGGWAAGGSGPACALATFGTYGLGGGRRGSMESAMPTDQYAGGTGMGHCTAGITRTGSMSGTAGADTQVMCTLLIGWARCGDLRRLAQLMLSRSAAHQPSKQTGGHPPVASLHPLMPEDAARFYTGCLVLALEHLHCRLHAVHRDLKLANVLLTGNGYAIVGDLGTAVDLTATPGGRLHSKVGSPGHMAPEVRDKDEAGYGLAADMWSLGACLYSMLTGQLPAGIAGPPSRSWAPQASRHWSHDLAVLVPKLLAWAPGHRPSVVQLMRDPWFRGFDWQALREQRMPPPSCTPWKELLWWPKEQPHLL